ncbi:mannitol dehydrogenase family protein [Aquincola sp. S2]|uniref:Mannitol dehydrogenase family protein n=1 Tax=Pseudaquabacterium terrae TaxID=2732868 RepID=A0ABX2EJN2_9BURK|nr:mannitol dehydrogenase family protein [Aquabacterium terrae]
MLQFGTGRFLQAHVDLLVSQAAERGEALGGITVVQTTGQPASVARMQALARARGYEVIVRGLVDGMPLERHETCRSVHEALDARAQWPAVRERVRGPVRVIVSNTGDAGWLLDPTDGPHLLAARASAAISFPAKLLVLLHDRWRAQPGSELTLLPCELVSRNGERLREIVMLLAREWSLGPAFVGWMREHLVWANSLVDRIVSQALDPVGAVAEPYALWAVEMQPRLQLPCRHASIVLTDDLAPFERRKLYLLNLAHTMLAQQWMTDRHPADMTVLQAMQTPALRDAIEAVWEEEVLPVFDAVGDGAGARAYLVELRDRLLNPFLAHALADIALNHAQKKARRIEPIIELARTLPPALAQPRLRAAVSAH